MFMMLERAARCVGVLGIFAPLAACDRQTVDATAQPYEIVTQMRPESLEAYMQTPRRAYDVCARVRAMQHLPPPPLLVPLPADFAMKRSTYLSSAIGYLIRHEEFNVFMEDDCKTRIASSMTEAVMRGGRYMGSVVNPAAIQRWLSQRLLGGILRKRRPTKLPTPRREPSAALACAAYLHPCAVA